MSRISRNAVLATALGTLLIACTGGKQPKNADGSFEPQGTKKRAELDSILVLLPDSSGVETTYNSLRDELADDFNVVPRTLAPDAGAAAISQAIQEVKPRCIVLFDNSVLRAYRSYRKEVKDAPPIPGAVLMTSFVEDFAAGMPELSGVGFEVPVATSAAMMRSVVDRPVTKIGVVHRKAFSGYVKRQTDLAKVEGLTIASAVVSDSPSVAEVKKAVSDLRENSKADAFWILNDNALLSPELIEKVWRPNLADEEVASIVGLDQLITPRQPLGTFAVVPDLAALGVQAANLVFDLSDDDWPIVGGRFQQPLSVRAVIDGDQAGRTLGLREDNMNQFSVALK